MDSEQVEQPKRRMSDQMQDFMIKYDAIEQKYRTSQLMNNEYKKHITFLEGQVKQQKQELLSFDEKVRASSQLQPIIEKSLNLYDVSLKENDEEIQELMNECKEYAKRVKELESENKNLREQNEKYRVLMEENKAKQQKISVKQHKKYDDKNMDIMKENEILRNQLNAYQAMDAHHHQNGSNNAHSMQYITIQMPENSPAHRIQFMQTPRSPQPQTPSSITYDDAYDIIAYGDSMTYKNIEEWEELDNLHHSTPNALILQQRLDKVEIYRNELMKKLNKINYVNDDEKCKDSPDFAIENAHDSWFGIKGDKSETKLKIDSPPNPKRQTSLFNWLQFQQYRY